jgi:hypothetical protein
MLMQSPKKLAVRPAALAALAVAGALLLPSAGAQAATTINGTVFADASHKENKDQATGAKSSDSGNGVDVKRFYFTVTHEFDSVWSAQFQSDIGDQGARRYDIFVKKAYVQAKLAPEAIFRLGSANTPWVPFVEDIYGYRYVEQVIIDRAGFGTSADWGVHFLGKAAGNHLNYALGVLNGKTYSNPARSKSVDFEGRVGAEPLPGLNFAVGGYTGKRGLDTYSAPARHTASRFDALGAFGNNFVRAGVEYFQAKNWNNVTTAATDKADGYSAWLSIKPVPGLAVFGRYDQDKPSKDLKPSLKDQLYLLGLEHRFNPSFAGSLVYKHEEVKGGTVSVSEGTIGSATDKGRYEEVGVWVLYTF